MGGGSYSADLLSARVSSHKSRGTDVFEYDALVRRKGVASATVHETLAPTRKAGAGSPFVGKVIRESRDSAEHPASNAVAILFDVTGSMGGIPRTFIEKLPKLMGAITKKGYLSDPQILFGAIGDAYSDRVPLQIGQFESSNEMDDALAKIYLEGRGGSQFHESYELAMHYMANFTAMDCLEKRGKKGYLFIIGDEKPYDKLNPDQVQRIIGEPVQEETPVEELVARLQEKFEVFWIFPKDGSSYSGERGRQLGIHDKLQTLFGQNLIWLDNPDDVCEVITATIGINEGYDINAVRSDMAEVGANSKSIVLVTEALSKRGAIVTKAKVSGEIVSSGADDSVSRL